MRPGILYGAEARPFLGRLSFPVPRGRGRRIVVGSKDALLPLTHVDNACDAIFLASYNVVDGATSQGEYLALLAQHDVAPIRPTYVPSALFTPIAAGCELATRMIGRSLPLNRYKLRRATESLEYNTSAAREHLGWSHSLDLSAGVATMKPASADRAEESAA